MPQKLNLIFYLSYSSKIIITEISISQAFEQLSSMKGGPSISSLRFALGKDEKLAKIASTHLKTSFLIRE